MRKGLWEKLKFDLGLERENERRNRGERILQVDMGGGVQKSSGYVQKRMSGLSLPVGKAIIDGRSAVRLWLQGRLRLA